jgi:hypothetical protein
MIVGGQWPCLFFGGYVDSKQISGDLMNAAAKARPQIERAARSEYGQDESV